MAVPNIFGSATAAIPLSQLDTNFATPVTIGNTAVQLGNTVTSFGNVTLTNVTISSGNVTVSAGSNTAPSITTVGDTNTGIFFPAADTIAFSEGGVEAMRIDSSGNVGIGVTPSAFATTQGTALQGYGWAIHTPANGGFNTLSISSNARNSASSTYNYIGTSVASMYQQFSAEHRWFNAPSGTAGNAITFTQAMTLDTSGRLLVGLTSTNSAFGGKLQVEGTSDAFGSLVRYSSTAASNPAFYFGRSKSATLGTNTIVASGDALGAIVFSGANGTGYSDAASIQGLVDGTPGASADMPGRLVFSTSADGSATPTERMRIDSSGNLMVGTTTLPASGGTTGFGVSVNTVRGQISLRASDANQQFLATFYNTNGQVGSIQTNGSATSYVTSSDYRLKNNIAPMTGALAKVLELNPVTYTWKSDGSDGQGFIAHELQEVYPDAVSGEKDGEQMQGVDYGKLTPILTAALQEAITKIETLEARIAVLEAK